MVDLGLAGDMVSFCSHIQILDSLDLIWPAFRAKIRISHTRWAEPLPHHPLVGEKWF